ncbi:hypothetical protein [Arthrobacter sp. ISL-5]|uniref:hypothetical protein n=1 Tax=Arthrobacter sp. ISL-5 TaxID=2819111 RepID=UPI001BECEFDE|nr:hypothetical protein [Arthrobacter sp. ISL-5]MBT2554193.1 hypothetical protein [Arthrobacter sp. ISL-5]
MRAPVIAKTLQVLMSTICCTSCDEAARFVYGAVAYRITAVASRRASNRTTLC